MDNHAWIVVAEGKTSEGLRVKEMFERAALLNPVHLVHNARELLQYLKGEGIYGNRDKFPLPGVLLLDCELPDISYEEILREMRAREGLRKIPVLVLVSTETEGRLDAAYEAGATSYLRKPFTFSDFLERSRIANLHFFIAGGRP